MDIVNLTGEWKLSNYSRKIDSIPMAIPGDNISALLKANIIKNPYYGFNEQDIQWIGKENWSLSTIFEYKVSESSKAYLHMEMVDTVFKLFINEKLVGNGENFFRTWIFDISDFIHDGKNSIRLEIDSPEEYAKSYAKKIPYPIPYSTYDVFSPHRNLLRKIQCQAGWDWGPCLMTSGIYGNIFIETVKTGYIKSVSVISNPESIDNLDGIWHTKIEIDYNSLEKGKAIFLVELTGNGKSIACSARKDVNVGNNNIELELEVKQPVLWKSADELKEEGKKENILYSLQITSLNHDSLKEESTVVKKIGFRTLTLNAEKDNSGCALYYKLNGRPIFAKGANWIPADALPSKWTKDRYEYLLNSAAEANMNCIRVWGGGMYETDTFYDICDRLGLIVWQDCTFACSLYPSTPDFLENVEQELKDNIYRLQSHPSLAVWCGNNEDLGALTWYEESKNNRDLYLVDYDRLNHGIVEKTISKHDPYHTWWPSSPCSGSGSFADNWHNDSAGDMHFWSVWHGREDMEKYMSIKPRFVSEFGYESFPSLEGVLEFTTKDHINLTDPVMEYHQRSPIGNSIILENFTRYFRFPTGTENMLYLSQVQQALAIKTAVQYWRSLRPYCMGATYWQLNDVWPVTSWSSIEYSGKWKLLHYAAKKFFAPLAIFAFKKDEILYVYAINETRHAKNISACIAFKDFQGNSISAPININTTLESNTATCIWQKPIKELDIKPNEVFVYTQITTENYTVDDTLFISKFKKCNLEKASIKYSIEEKEGIFHIILSTDKPAFYVSIESTGIKGHFSDNMFTLLPENQRDITFSMSNYGNKDTTKNISKEELINSIKIISLRDTYE